MRIYNTSDISPSAGAPWKATSIDFLQKAYGEPLALLSKSIVALSTTYVPGTCYTVSGTYSYEPLAGYEFSNGLCVFDDEVFSYDGFTARPGDFFFGKMDITNDPFADPTTFSDTSIHNIHNIRKMSIVGGTSSPPTYTIPVDVTSMPQYKLNQSFYDMVVNYFSFNNGRVNLLERQVTGTSYISFGPPFYTSPNWVDMKFDLAPHWIGVTLSPPQYLVTSINKYGGGTSSLRVEFRGMIKLASLSATDRFYTMATGSRPKYTIQKSLISYNTGSTIPMTALTDGQLQCIMGGFSAGMEIDISPLSYWVV